MKKKFEMPTAVISIFDRENIVTSSGDTNVSLMTQAMESKGYKAKAVDLSTLGWTW